MSRNTATISVCLHTLHRLFRWLIGCCLAGLGAALFLNPALAADCVQVGDLTWEVKTDDGGLRDKDNFYYWYDNVLINNSTAPGQPGQIGQGCTGNIPCDTQSYVQAVNAQKVCGYSDWRMPTWEELQSLVNLSYSPTIDPNLFPNTVRGRYWTRATTADIREQAWFHDFTDGSEGGGDKNNWQLYVRLVRGNEASPRCVTLGNLTWEVKSGRGTLQAFDNHYYWYDTSVTNNSGVPGAQGTLGIGCTGGIQCDTQSYVQAVNAQKLCGYSDWRMPTWEELKSLIDLTHSPMIDPNLFPNTVRGRYWTRATTADIREQAWFHDFTDGSEGGGDKNNWQLYVRLVRGNEASPRCVTLGNLTWEVKSGRGTLQAFDNRYFWYDPVNHSGVPGTEGTLGIGCTGGIQCDSNKYINELNEQNLCGYHDWRMPTRVELGSLINLSYSPTIDPSLFPNTVRGSYWTGTTNAENSGAAWFRDFSDGSESEWGDKYNWQLYVRAVRNSSNDVQPINLSSSNTGHAKPVTGTLSEQLDVLNAGPPAFNDTWVPVKRHSDHHINNAFVCNEVSDPLTEPYVAVGDLRNFITGVDEVTYNNCDSAFYRFTFTLPTNFAPMCLKGEANVDDQGVAFLNGHRISGAMNNPGCNPDPVNGPTDPCYAEQDVRKDRKELPFAPIMDGDKEVLAWPNTGHFETCNTGYFKPGLNELVFAVAGDASYYEPTGLEFTAQVTGTGSSSSGFSLSVSKVGSGAVTSNPAGINCGTDCSENYASGATVTLKAVPANGWKRSLGRPWQGCDTADGSTCTVIMNAAKTVTATFNPVLQVTHNGNGVITSVQPGIDCGIDCENSYALNSDITLTATPAAGFTLTRWGGACTGVAATCTVRMNEPKNVTATFGNGGSATTLITHYYVSILEREPDADGLAFWLNRIAENQAQGIDVKPVFRDMANFFLNSPEYLGRNTTDRQFITNLYLTFFQREPDEGGYAFWLDQLANGMTRNTAMGGFLYSQEFTDFMESLGF